MSQATTPVASLTARQASGHSIHDNIIKDHARAHYGDVYGGVHNYATDAEDRQQDNLADLIRWLDAPDPTNDHYEAQRRHEIGTGSWFLDSKAFKSWLSDGEPVLWLYGPPGCCKTILCSAAIERTKEKSCTGAMAYFYFTFRDPRKQVYDGFLRSIISQLARRGNVPDNLRSARDYGRRHHSTLEQIAAEIIQQIPKVYLLVDALDECPKPGHNRSTMMAGLNSIARQCPGLRLLVTSRTEPDIAFFIHNELDSKFLAIEARPVNEDIKLYVERELDRDRKLRRLSDGMKTYIAQDLANKASGMFRWADLQLDTLKQLQILRPDDIYPIMNTLPRTLDETYDRILLQFDNSKEVLSVLRWVAFEKFPRLTFATLREACITKYERGSRVDTANREAMHNLVRDMSSLLRFGYVESEASEYFDRVTVSFAHRSVEEYLQSKYIKAGPAAHFHLDKGISLHNMAQTCISYLGHVRAEWQGRTGHYNQFSKVTDHMRTDVLRNTEGDLAREFPLFRHAANYWMIYLRQAECELGTSTSGEIYVGLESLVAPFLQYSCEFLRMLYFIRPPEEPEAGGLLLVLSASHHGFGIVAAAAWGLSKTLAILVEKETSAGRTAPDVELALLVASRNATSVGIVQYLLDNGVDSDMSDCFSRLADNILLLSKMALNPRCNISISGTAEMIHLYKLLHPTSSCRVNAFRWAIDINNRSAVAALCKAGVDPNTSMGSSGSLSALQYVCNFHTILFMIKTLLEAGVDPNLPKHGVRPLWIVLFNDHGRGVIRRHGDIEWLLAAGADPNSGRDDGTNAETALQIALRKGKGYEKSAKLLLNAGASHDFKIESHGSEIVWKPLFHANDLTEDECIEKIRQFLCDSGYVAGGSVENNLSLAHLMMPSRIPATLEPWRRTDMPNWSEHLPKGSFMSTRSEVESAALSDVD